MCAQYSPGSVAGKVSRGSAVPLYHQIASDLRQRILSGAWGASDRLPSEGELSESYGTSRVTVRQALRILVDEGLLARQAGRGSFVRGDSIAASTRRLTSFTAEMHMRNMRSSAHVLNQQVTDAEDDVADALDVSLKAPVLWLRRLRYGDDRPIGVQSSHIDYLRFPQLAEVDFTTESLYGELHRRYGVVVDEADEIYSATIVDDFAASLLSIPRGSPALRVIRRGFSAGVAIEYTISIMRADSYHIEMRLARSPDSQSMSPGQTRFDPASEGV